MDVVQTLWGFCNTLRHDGINYGDYIEQLTYLLFLKLADEKGLDLPDGYNWPTLRALSGTDLNDLRGPRGFLVKAKGSDLRLARWDERTRSDLGNPHPSGMLSLIDMLHRLMWLWASGDMAKLRAYAGDHGLSQNDLFWAVAQAVLEMSAPKSKERTLLEVLVAWGRGKETPTVVQQERLL